MQRPFIPVTPRLDSSAPGAGPLDSAAQNAIATGAGSTPAQTIGGTIATITQTTPGALGTTIGHNAGFAGIGNIAADDPGIPAFAWIVTLLFQGAKHSKHVNQDTAKWFLVPLMAFILLAVYFGLSTHGDWFLAGASALKSTGLVAINAIANYHSVKPLGWLGPAADIVNT